jgi:hypothetical protein
LGIAVTVPDSPDSPPGFPSRIPRIPVPDSRIPGFPGFPGFPPGFPGIPRDSPDSRDSRIPGFRIPDSAGFLPDSREDSVASLADGNYGHGIVIIATWSP